jgi:hypothetical protein
MHSRFHFGEAIGFSTAMLLGEKFSPPATCCSGATAA